MTRSFQGITIVQFDRELCKKVIHEEAGIFGLSAGVEIPLHFGAVDLFCDSHGIHIPECLDFFPVTDCVDGVRCLLRHELIHWLTVFVSSWSKRRPRSLYELLAFHYGERTLYEEHYRRPFTAMRQNFGPMTIDDVVDLFETGRFRDYYIRDIPLTALAYSIFRMALPDFRWDSLRGRFACLDAASTERKAVLAFLEEGGRSIKEIVRALSVPERGDQP